LSRISIKVPRSEKCFSIIDCLLCFVPLKNLSLIWKGHHYRYVMLIRRPAPFTSLLQHARKCWGSILTRIFIGLFQCVSENCLHGERKYVKASSINVRSLYCTVQNSEVQNVWNVIIIQEANRKLSVGQHGPPTNAKTGSGAMDGTD
jgi:hypothetical protein